MAGSLIVKKNQAELSCSTKLPPDRPVVEISRSLIQHNIATLRSEISPGTKLCAVLKANGYGLGDRFLASIYCKKSSPPLVDAFLLSSFWEAKRLRTHVPDTPLFALDCPKECIRECTDLQIEVILHSLSQLKEILPEIPSKKKLKVQINFNTGMSRLDCHFDEAYELAMVTSREEKIELTGIMSHLNCADDPSQDLVSQSQIAAFETLVLALSRKNISLKHTHILNSCGICRFHSGLGSMVRSGIGLLGCQPKITTSKATSPPPLKGALSFSAPLRQVLEIEAEQPLGYNRIKAPKGVKRVAIVQMGYADGLPRIPTKQAAMQIGASHCPVIAHTCMDFCFVDVTKTTTKDRKIGQRAYLFKKECCDEKTSNLTIQEACTRWQVRPYEWLVHISSRTKRLIVS